jgi:hypothetical protein
VSLRRVADIPTFRNGFQIWPSLGITGLYVWPWLDLAQRRNARGINAKGHRNEVYFRTADFFGGAVFFQRRCSCVRQYAN